MTVAKCGTQAKCSTHTDCGCQEAWDARPEGSPGELYGKHMCCLDCPLPKCIYERVKEKVYTTNTDPTTEEQMRKRRVQVWVLLDKNIPGYMIVKTLGISASTVYRYRLMGRPV